MAADRKRPTGRPAEDAPPTRVVHPRLVRSADARGASAGRIGGAAALTGISGSVVLMTLVGSWRPSAAVPALDRPGLRPRLPWAPATDLAVTVLLWVAMIVATAGRAALRRGWRPAARRYGRAGPDINDKSLYMP